MWFAVDVISWDFARIVCVLSQNVSVRVVYLVVLETAVTLNLMEKIVLLLNMIYHIHHVFLTSWKMLLVRVLLFIPHWTLYRIVLLVKSPRPLPFLVTALFALPNLSGVICLVNSLWNLLIIAITLLFTGPETCLKCLQAMLVIPLYRSCQDYFHAYCFESTLESIALRPL